MEKISGQKSKSSKHRGVSYFAERDKWLAYFYIPTVISEGRQKYKQVYLGIHDTEDQAIDAHYRYNAKRALG